MPQLHRGSLLALLMLMSLLVTEAGAQSQDPAPRVLKIAPAQPEMQVRGQISGHQTLTYVFDSPAGVDTSVSLDHPGSASLYHNVISPSGALLFNGSMDGTRFQAVLDQRGRYQVRVYLMRNDARRGKRVAFTLKIRQSVQPAHAATPSFDCRKARGPVETAVCRSPALSELDARLDFVYRDAIAGASSRRADEIRRDQRRWMQERESCSRERQLEQCVAARYTARIGQLAPKR